MDHPRLRSNVGRVAVPIAKEPSRPSLVPQDVWEQWQQELATSDEAGGVEEVITSTENLYGLGASTPADHEVALFALRHVKLFSKAEPSALEGMARSARQGELASGDYLFREDTYASSFYVVLDGALEILRRTDGREVALRHIERGEVVGLFGLLSGQRRAACARAIGDVVLLEVPAEAVSAAIAAHDVLRSRLVRFYEERLLEGFVASSKLFADLDAIARARIIGRFGERQLKAGEALVNPGEVANALCVVISGKLLLEDRSAPGTKVRLFELFSGEFLALTSAFSGAPCRMRVYAQEPAIVVMLGQRELAELSKDYPALRALTSRLPGSAQQLERDVWCGHTAVPGL